MSLNPGPKPTTKESDKTKKDERHRVDKDNKDNVEKHHPPLKKSTK